MREKYLLFGALIAFFTGAVNAETSRSMTAPAGQTVRASAVAQTTGRVAPARMATIKYDNGTPSTASTGAAVAVVSEDVQTVSSETDAREKERLACVSNNIGAGNTFVWASRLSNTGNYSSMVEDTENPDNNVCYVRVELKSNDSRINTSDLTGRYFQMGETITCGNWVDEEKLEKRILDAKKSARTWGTVAGAVGGAGVGVGAMELFGNKLIGGAVQGQKDLSGNDLLESQLLVLKKDDKSKYDKIIAQLKIVKEECDKVASDVKMPDNCTVYDYERLLKTESK